MAILQLVTIVASWGDVNTLGEAYAFGVIWSFVFKTLAMVVLRFKDKSPRQYEVPLNIRIRRKMPLGDAEPRPSRPASTTAATASTPAGNESPTHGRPRRRRGPQARHRRHRRRIADAQNHIDLPIGIIIIFLSCSAPP